MFHQVWVITNEIDMSAKWIWLNSDTIETIEVHFENPSFNPDGVFTYGENNSKLGPTLYKVTLFSGQTLIVPHPWAWDGATLWVQLGLRSESPVEGGEYDRGG